MFRENVQWIKKNIKFVDFLNIYKQKIIGVATSVSKIIKKNTNKCKYDKRELKFYFFLVYCVFLVYETTKYLPSSQ